MFEALRRRAARLVIAPFEVGRRDLAERAVAAARVVPAFDVGEEGQPRLGLCLPAAPVDQLALEGGSCQGRTRQRGNPDERTATRAACRGFGVEHPTSEAVQAAALANMMTVLTTGAVMCDQVTSSLSSAVQTAIHLNSALPLVEIPAGHVGPVVLPGSGRMIWWTGRVAIGLRHESAHDYDMPSQSALWVQDLMIGAGNPLHA